MCKCYTKGDGGGWDPASICSFVFPYSEAPAFVASNHSQASFMISLLWTNFSIESLLSISEIRPRRPQEQVSGKLFRAPHRGRRLRMLEFKLSEHFPRDTWEFCLDSPEKKNSHFPWTQSVLLLRCPGGLIIPPPPSLYLGEGPRWLFPRHLLL